MSALGEGLAPGEKIGRYVCLRRLAFGGMAELYLARLDIPQRFEKYFVVKRVLPHLSADPEFVTMFMREAQLASTLDHDGIAAVVDFGDDGGHYLVMEYLHGRDVRALLREGTKSGPLPLAPALTIVRDVAHALHYAHERRAPSGEELGVVHRDVSPSNIMVTYEGAVKLLDFGIAKATSQTRATRTGTIKGKVGYMSPEQCATKPVDRRSDVFALSVVLYELTTGRRAFAADNEFAVMNLVAKGEVVPPQEWVEDYPPELAAIVGQGLARDRDERFPDARTLALALEAFASSTGTTLSHDVVAEYIRALFPEPVHPRMDDTLQTVGAFAKHTVVSGPPSRSTSRTRRRSTRLRVGGALVVGVGLGLTVSFVGGGRSSEAAAPTEPPAKELAPPAAEPAPTPVAAPVPALQPPSSPSPSTDPAPESEVASANADTGSTPTSEPTPTRQQKPRKKSGRRSRSPRSKRKAAKVVESFRPPSERGGK